VMPSFTHSQPAQVGAQHLGHDDRAVRLLVGLENRDEPANNEEEVRIS